MSGMHRHRVGPSEKEKRHSRFSWIFRIAAAALFNGYVIGFAKGKSYTGDLKVVCVPVLNCYSCPGALGSCPIGALQAVLGSPKHNFSFYVLGTLMLFGTVLGRLVCGFLCPFGLIQDLLHKIPVKKLTVPVKVDKPLRYVKYLVLLIAVVLLPLVATDAFGLAPPFFCKYICPAGTLEGGFFHLLMNKSLRKLVGGLFDLKLIILILVVAGSIFINRFFCRYLCPLGAFYALFNKFSLVRLEIDRDKCIGCKKCENVCPMAVQVLKNPNSAECIRCGKCKAACPTEAIRNCVKIEHM